MLNFNKTIILSVLAIVCLFRTENSFAQCDSLVPTFTLDLTGSPDSMWVSPSVTKNGNCCGTIAPEKCVDFIVNVDSTTVGLKLDIVSGALPPGALYYQVGCGPLVPLSEVVTLPQAGGTHQVTFCKAGNNVNTYGLRAFGQPVSNFNSSNLNPCQNEIVYLTNSSLSADMFVWKVNGVIKSDSTNFIFPSDTVGTFNIELVAMNGPFRDSTVRTINVQELPSSTVTTNGVLCFGDASGSATVSGTGGTVPYMYSWSNGATTSSATNLTAGSYSVLLTDANNCSNTNSVIISQPTQFTLTFSSSDLTDVSCTGGNNGSYFINASGGTLPYNYSWSNGQTSAAATNLTVGYYFAQVSDANGCGLQQLDSILISEPDSIILTFDVIDAFCSNNNGQVDLSVTGGIAPYNFTWSNGPVTEDQVDLSEGIYAVTVSDMNGCSKSDSIYVNSTYDPVLDSATYALASCDISCDGSITLLIQDTTGVTYLWDDPNAQTGNIATNLCSGAYSVYIEGPTGCNITQYFTLFAQDNDPIITGNVNYNSQPVFEGVVNLYRVDTASGAFALVDTSNIIGNGTYSFIPVMPGEYIVSVTADTSVYPNTITTYAYGTFRWDMATTVTLNCGTVSPVNIDLLSISPLTGTGTIGGIVMVDSSSRVPGDPVPGVDVSLEQNPGGIVVANTTTDSSGSYTFDNVPVGSYTIFVDIPGLGMTATYSVDVTSTDTVFINKDFFVDSIGTIDTVRNFGILTQTFYSEVNNNHLRVYPNPFTNNLKLDLNLSEKTEVTIELFDLLGKMITTSSKTKFEAGNYNKTIELGENNPPGVYLIKVILNGNPQLIKVVKL